MGTMTRDELFKTVKEVVTAILPENEALLLNDEQLKKEWASKTDTIRVEMPKLNASDALWMAQEYDQWFKKEIKVLTTPPMDYYLRPEKG